MLGHSLAPTFLMACSTLVRSFTLNFVCFANVFQKAYVVLVLSLFSIVISFHFAFYFNFMLFPLFFLVQIILTLIQTPCLVFLVFLFGFRILFLCLARHCSCRGSFSFWLSRCHFCVYTFGYPRGTSVFLFYPVSVGS